MPGLLDHRIEKRQRHSIRVAVLRVWWYVVCVCVCMCEGGPRSREEREDANLPLSQQTNEMRALFCGQKDLIPFLLESVQIPAFGK